MRKITTILFLFVTVTTSAKNYFVTKDGDNSTGLSPATAFKTIARLNAMFSIIAPGDNILFNRGESYYGSIVATKSGTPALPITISYFGTGASPVITGLTTLSSWSLRSAGIYQCLAPTLKYNVNLLLINGTAQRVGRWPNIDATNGGYLTYTDFTGNTSLTAAGLSGTNWTGAEVVARKEGFKLERDSITSQTGGKISYLPYPSINPRADGTTPVAYTTTATGWGLFIQRDVRTLDQFGEWNYDKHAKYMQVFFGSNSPSSYLVQAPTIDTLANLGSVQNITIDGIDFEGAGMAAIFFHDGANIKIVNTVINNSGVKAIFGWASSNTIVDNCNIANSMCGAIDCTSRGVDGCTITNSTVKNTGIFAGMSSFFNDADCKAIYVSVRNNALIQFNEVDTSGFVAIQFQGSHILVKNNLVNYFDFIKDDGGGIYTFNDNSSKVDRIIEANFVLNGIGQPYGTQNPIHDEAIYTDGASKNVNKIIGNICININGDMVYLNDPGNSDIRNNIGFNCGWNMPSNSDRRGGFGINKHLNDSIYNTRFANNIIYNTLPYQRTFQYVNEGFNSTRPPVVSSLSEGLKKVAVIDSNFYHPGDASGFKFQYRASSTDSYIFPSPSDFTAWQALSGQDSNSVILEDGYQLFYNASKIAVDVHFTGFKKKDHLGNTYDNSISLNPYQAMILAPDGAAGTVNLPPVSDAGEAVTVQLPVDSTTLDGSASADPDGAVASYLWTIVSGSSGGTIADPAAPVTEITGMTVGNYSIRLTITDNLGATATSLKSIRVLPAYVPPCINCIKSNRRYKNE